MPIVLSKSERLELQELRDEGLEVKEIMNKTGRSAKTISKYTFGLRVFWTTESELDFVYTLRPHQLPGYAESINNRAYWGAMDKDAIKATVNARLSRLAY